MIGSMCDVSAPFAGIGFFRLLYCANTCVIASYGDLMPVDSGVFPTTMLLLSCFCVLE